DEPVAPRARAEQIPGGDGCSEGHGLTTTWRAEHILPWKTTKRREDGIRATPAPVRLRRARADDRREDDGDPPREAPSGVRDQPERGPRGNRVGGQDDRRGAHESQLD